MRKVQPGEPITAQLFNDLVEQVAALANLTADNTLCVQRGPGGVHLSANQPQFDLIEFASDCPPGYTDRTAKLLTRDWSASSPPADQWKDLGQDLGLVADPALSLYLTGERHLAYFHPGAGQRIPVPGTQWHLAKAQVPIPPEGSGNVLVYRVSGGSYAYVTNLTAYDWAGYGIMGSPAPCLIWQHLQSKRWYAINLCGHSWGRAQSAWSENGGNPVVSVKTVGYWGDTTTYGSAFDVQLPRFNFGSTSTYTSRDPNVQSGDWIMFIRNAWNPASGIGLGCISPYLDDKLGTIKAWYWTAANRALPGGWAICDGTNGTPDLRSKFLRGVPNGGTMGTTGGSTTHSHAAHAAHNHDVRQSGGSAPLTPNAVQLDHTGITEYVFPSDQAVVTDNANQMGHDSPNHEPPYRDVYWIMRVS